jgi:hypothetical protein
VPDCRRFEIGFSTKKATSYILSKTTILTLFCVSMVPLIDKKYIDYTNIIHDDNYLKYYNTYYHITLYPKFYLFIYLNLIYKKN